MNKMRVVVAMSGGVDSSVVAGLLVEQGYDVVGLSMKTHGTAPAGNRACCTPDDMRDARSVADRLGIPFYVLNYADVFKEEIIKPFAEAYLQGRTPNPCVECNHRVKFKPLLQRAKVLGAAKLATGHYASLTENRDRVLLRRGRDSNKDQSYFLYRLNQSMLSELMFPLGDMTKAEVRAHALRLGLAVAEKRESQEICFVGAEGYAATVERISGRKGKVGKFVGPTGEDFGAHEGIHHFTLGQRKGLGIAHPTPLYVTHIDAATGNVHVGPQVDLEVHDVVVENVHWAADALADGSEILLQQRYREKPRAARIFLKENGSVRAEFLEPGPRGAPGQAAVFYVGDCVVGGGVLASMSKPRTFGRASLPVMTAP